jgi:DNA-binding transcriptional LysR family regulator
MERQELEALLTLAEELHFGRTAERLGLTVGRISQIIGRLERRIGVPLFERTSRRVALTPVGQKLRDDLRPAHRMIEDAVARAVAAGRGITGELHVGYSSPLAADLVLRTIAAFRTSHPDCDVTFQMIHLNAPYDLLRSGQVDLQITALPVEEPDLVVGPTLITSDHAVMVPDAHPFARRTSLSLEDLAHTTNLAIHGAVPQHWLDHHFPHRTPAGLPIPYGPPASSWHDLPYLVAAGAGVSLANADAEAHYNCPGVTWVPVRESMPCHHAPIWRRQGASAKVRAFVSAVTETARVRDGGGKT